MIGRAGVFQTDKGTDKPDAMYTRVRLFLVKKTISRRERQTADHNAYFSLSQLGLMCAVWRAFARPLG